jgi:hypothetical protein
MTCCINPTSTISLFIPATIPDSLARHFERLCALSSASLLQGVSGVPAKLGVIII